MAQPDSPGHGLTRPDCVQAQVVDASWVWTEPHSRRLRVKLTVRKEVLSGTTVQQSAVIDYIVRTRNCERCNKLAAKDTWQAKVQLRQRADHPRTLFAREPQPHSTPWESLFTRCSSFPTPTRTAVEQAIAKQRLARGAVKVERARDGLDFNFHKKQVAI